MSFHDLIAHFFSVLNNDLLSECTRVYVSIHLHLGCFQVLTVLNKVAIKIHVQVFMWF